MQEEVSHHPIDNLRFVDDYKGIRQAVQSQGVLSPHRKQCPEKLVERSRHNWRLCPFLLLHYNKLTPPSTDGVDFTRYFLIRLRPSTSDLPGSSAAACRLRITRSTLASWTNMPKPSTTACPMTPPTRNSTTSTAKATLCLMLRRVWRHISVL